MATPTPRKQAGKGPYEKRAYAVGPDYGFEPASRRCPECGTDLLSEFFRFSGEICSICDYQRKHPTQRKDRR